MDLACTPLPPEIHGMVVVLFSLKTITQYSMSSEPGAFTGCCLCGEVALRTNIDSKVLQCSHWQAYAL